MLQRIIRESFVPVTMVFAGLFLLLVYSRYQVEVEAERVTVIRVAAATPAASLDLNADDRGVDTGDVSLDRYSNNTTDDPRYRRAAELMDRSQWQEAEDLLREIIAREPTSQALNDLGVLYLKQGRESLARVQFDQAVTMEPVFPGAWFNRGLLLARAGDDAGAAEHYRRVTARNPNHFEAHYNLGLALLRQDDTEGALKAFTTAQNLAGGARKARALYGQGLALRDTGKDRYPEAVEAFQAAIRLSPGYVAPRMELAELEPDTAEGNRRATDYFEQALRLAPTDAVVHFQIGLFHSTRGHRRQSIDAYRKAVQFNPEYRKARYNLGLQLLADDRFGDARAEFQWIVERHPDHAESYFNLGRVAYGEKRYGEAISLYRKAIDLRGGAYPEGWLNTGLTFVRLKDPKRAILAYEEALKIKADYPEAWYNLGFTHMRAEAWEQAEAAFRNAIRYRPDYYRAWFNLGVMFTRQDRLQAAEGSYRNALKINPSYDRARINLALVLSKTNSENEAVTLYREVLDRDSTYATAWRNLGLLLLDLKRPDEARDAFRSLLKLAPDDTDTMRYLSRALIDLNDFDAAIRVLSGAVDHDAADPNLRTALGDAYHAAGREAEAKAEYEKARRLQKN
ncbi:MAG: tetratricopeptide repeat protein [Nitrospirota bacterium]|nr:tetratricopeptide repeat protein [Nitrospirota bacterium]